MTSTISGDLLPITEDDDFIRAALEEAHTPALMAAMAQITGDMTILRGSIKPDNSVLGDLQAGISLENQEIIRARALDVFKSHRDAGNPRTPTPTHDQLREMMNFIIGQEIPEDYLAFLEEELGIHATDHNGSQKITQTAQAFHVLVIGAGMSGILAGIRLKEAGIPFTIIEKNADVGGTWLDNSYPGCRVDSPNHVYSYSFAPNHNWPQHFSQREALYDYFSQCTNEFGVKGDIQFNTEVRALAYKEDQALWSARIRHADGAEETLQANAVITATGQLNRPKFPDIPNRESFKGYAFHSAEWDHSVDLKGKRIAVIGTGASAFQFVPEIAADASELKIFQRTPPWMGPAPHYHHDVPEGKKWLLKHAPFYAQWYRFWMFWITAEGALESCKVDPTWNDQARSVSRANDDIRLLLTAHIEHQVEGDQDLFEKITPTYPPGGKRMLRDNGVWVEALRRENVDLITDPITKIVERGVQTDDDTVYEADVIIYGTGFKADEFLAPMKITGANGADLHERWAGDARAYLGVTMPGFPNLFSLYGPNTNIVVNGSIIFFSECEMRYIIHCLRHLIDNGKRAMSCKQSVHDQYNEWVDEGNRMMAWGSPHVTSWYKNATGRVAQNWPYTLLEYWSQTRSLNPDDYQFT